MDWDGAGGYNQEVDSIEKMKHGKEQFVVLKGWCM